MAKTCSAKEVANAISFRPAPIVDEQPVNPKYYEKMSELLDALIEQLRKEALDYQEYLKSIVELAKKVAHPETEGSYPKSMNTPVKRAVYDNLENDEDRTLRVCEAVEGSRQDDWKGNSFKIRKVKNAIKGALNGDEELADKILDLLKNQREY